MCTFSLPPVPSKHPFRWIEHVTAFSLRIVSFPIVIVSLREQSLLSSLCVTLTAEWGWRRILTKKLLEERKKRKERNQCERVSRGIFVHQYWSLRTTTSHQWVMEGKRHANRWSMGLGSSHRKRGICSSHEGAPARIVMVGLDSAGKSTILARFMNLIDQQSNPNVAFIERIDTIPTFVYQVETIYPRLAPLALNVWDLGGQEKTRELWKFYTTGVEGIFSRTSIDHSWGRDHVSLMTMKFIIWFPPLDNRSFRKKIVYQCTWD